MQRHGRLRHFGVLAGTILWVSCAAGTQQAIERPAQSESVKGALGQKLDHYLTFAERLGFSGTVLVAKGDDLLLYKGYGFADRNRSLKNGPNTIHSVGSIGKQFTAAAIMTLEMDGKLHTADSVGKYFTGLPEEKGAITIHQLLTHTSGLAPMNFLNEFPKIAENQTTDQIAGVVLEGPLNFEPGAEFSYSNGGYLMLALVIEKVSGQNFQDYVREHLLLPAGMKSAGYGKHNWGALQLAKRYLNNKESDSPAYHPEIVTQEQGAGPVLATAHDMFLWHQALLDDVILSRSAKEKMYTPQLQNYGYGWDIIQTPDGLLIQHNGGTSDGVSAEFLRYIDAGITIIVMSNQGYAGIPFMAGPIKNDLVALVFGDPWDLPRLPDMGHEVDANSFAANLDLADGSITLTPVGNIILAQGDGAAASGLLSASTPTALSAELSDKSVQLIEAAMNGQLETFSHIFSSEDQMKRTSQFIAMRTKRYAAQMGEVVGVTAARAASSELHPGALKAGVIVQGTHSDISYWLHWDSEGNYLGLQPTRDIDTVTMLMMPTGHDELLGYNFAERATISLGVERDAQGQITKIDRKGM